MTQENNFEELQFEDELMEEVLNTDNLDNEALWQQRREDATHIPLYNCTPTEQLVIAKCINEQELTPTEEETLLKVLDKYGEAIQKVNPQEILDNHEKNADYIEAEKTFLEILEEQKREDKTITLDYPLHDGSVKTVTLTVLKADSTIISDVQKDLGMFSDFTPQENKVRIKQEQGQILTPEEQAILEEVQRKLSAKLDEDPISIMIEFLAKTTRIKEEPQSDYQYMKKVYQNIDFYILEPLFDRVSRMSGVVTPNADKLFH